MKMKLSVLVAVAVMAMSSSTFAVSIGLNFVGGRGSGGNGTGGTAGNAVNGVAGVEAQDNWNNGFGANNGVPLALVDSDGNATGATATWTGVPNSWAVSGAAAGTAAADGDAELMNGYLDTNTSSTTTITVFDVPYHQYDVIVYYDGDAAIGRSGNYTVNGMTVLGQDFANWPVGGPAPTAGAFDDATFDNVGNFIRFSDINANNVNATAMAVVFRGPINGIQIVAVPEPASVALIGMAGLAFIRRRRAA